MKDEFKARLHQEWRDLLFLHWRVEPDLLAPLLPPALRVETFGDAAWLGIIPFRMERIRVAGLPPVPGCTRFLELNVRTYVRHRESRQTGVWFFSLDANHAVAVQAARRQYRLNYRRARLSHRVEGDRHTFEGLRRGETEVARFAYRPEPVPPVEAEPSSLEAFLLERYRLFAGFPGEPVRQGTVAHIPYRFQPVRLEAWSAAPARWDGIDPGDGPPDHACFAPGFAVQAARISAPKAAREEKDLVIGAVPDSDCHR